MQKSFKRILSVLATIVLATVFSTEAIANQPYACGEVSATSAQIVRAEGMAVCPCCSIPADCCPTRPVPSNRQPLDVGLFSQERSRGSYIQFEPARLVATVQLSVASGVMPTQIAEPSLQTQNPPVRLYLLKRSLLI
jgi:hypothetical protein